MANVNWIEEKDNLESLIEKRVPYSEIAKIYGLRSGTNIKKMAIKLGIKIINPKTGEPFLYEKPEMVCKYCGEKFDDKYKLSGHVTYCKSNPNYLNNLENTKNARKHKKHTHDKCNKELECKYCGKIVHNEGCLKIHENACELNPNRVKNPNRTGNGGHTKGHVAWNKGKTAIDNESIVKQIESKKESIKNGKYCPKGHEHTDETKRILREKMIAYIKNVGNGKFGQHFSEKGCKYIDFLNEKNGWNLIHAKNGGEKEVCGYFLDGYDPDLNIAFEYDEPRHYEDVYNNVLSEKDIKRQNEIIKELNCKFYRYNEKLDKLYIVN